ncbi:POU domain class 2-associating factor 1 [Symphorus nematophorus]
MPRKAAQTENGLIALLENHQASGADEKQLGRESTTKLCGPQGRQAEAEEKALCTEPVLSTPNLNEPFTVQTDASGTGLGAGLSQVRGREQHLVPYISSPPSALARPKPYQGVRVRDPVKELLRRKRSLEPQSTKTAPPTADVVAHNNNQSSSYTQAIFGSDVAGSSPAEPSVAVGDAGLQGAGWKGAPSAATGAGTGAGLQSAVTPWSSSDYNQQERSAQTLAYSATPALTADVYMQTLCPSYTMLTYTHAPLLTNFGTIPVGTAPATLPQMELPDSGLTYLPWAQPLTTISTMPNPGVQFAPGSAALPGSSLVHMPLSMSLTTMIPQGVDPQPQILDLQRPDHPLDPDQQGQSLDEDAGVEPESPSLLDKLLEEQKDDSVEEDKDSYSSSLFIPNV